MEFFKNPSVLDIGLQNNILKLISQKNITRNNILDLIGPRFRIACYINR
jgi:hypothetical protein